MSQALVVLLLGSNLGDTKDNIESALHLIEQNIGVINKRSKILESIPVEYDSIKIFRNIAVGIQTSFSPVDLLKRLKHIEKSMGRTQDSSVSGRYLDRIIDIDIVYYGGIKFISSKLLIPHKKHIEDRDFSKQLLSQL